MENGNQETLKSQIRNFEIEASNFFFFFFLFIPRLPVLGNIRPQEDLVDFPERVPIFVLKKKLQVVGRFLYKIFNKKQKSKKIEK